MKGGVARRENLEEDRQCGYSSVKGRRLQWQRENRRENLA